MNIQGPGTMGGPLKASILADVDSLLSDSTTKTSAILSSPTGSSFNPSSGTAGTNIEQDTVDAWVTPLEQGKGPTDSPYQLGDVQVWVVASDLTVAPSTSTYIRLGGERYGVFGVDTDPLTGYHAIMCRKAGT